MFPDTDLPLALIMEEILEWEKKPDSDKDNKEEWRRERLQTSPASAVFNGSDTRPASLFWPDMGGYSIFAYCLDGTDQGVRLDWYMEEEGNIGGWKVEACYILEQMRDVETMSDLTRIELEDDTICYGFGDSSTCIRVCETNENGKIRLEPLAGNQMIDGQWVDLPIDRIYGYCTLLERHLNSREGD